MFTFCFLLFSANACQQQDSKSHRGQSDPKDVKPEPGPIKSSSAADSKPTEAAEKPQVNTPPLDKTDPKLFISTYLNGKTYTNCFIQGDNSSTFLTTYSFHSDSKSYTYTSKIYPSLDCSGTEKPDQTMSNTGTYVISLSKIPGIWYMKATNVISGELFHIGLRGSEEKLYMSGFETEARFLENKPFQYMIEFKLKK